MNVEEVFLARPRKWTEEQREQALRLYVEMGPTEASKVTGIPKQYIARWGKAKGLVTVTNERTRAATETIAERWRLKQQVIIEGLADMIIDALARRNQPHVEYVGQAGNKVTFSKAPPAAFLAYATAIEKNVRTLSVMAGKSGHGAEQVTNKAPFSDEERALLRAAIEWDLARREREPIPGGE